MPKTQIADVIIPDVWVPYVINRTKELSAFWQSGIVMAEPRIKKLVQGGGRIINMPYWNDLSGDDEVLSDSDALTPEKIDSGQDKAVLFLRGKAWSVNDLAEVMAGSDPMAAIGNLTAEYWKRRFQALILSILKGVFAASSLSDNIHDISALVDDAAYFTAISFLDAKQLLGDARDELSAIAMHSATVTSLAKQDLIETKEDSKSQAVIKTFMSHRIIEDDGMPNDGTNFTTYLFAPGALGYEEATGLDEAVETDRDILAGDDVLTHRRHFVLHPRGIAFQDDTVAGAAPTNAECEIAANWERVYETKKIRMIKFVHKLAG